MRKYHIVLALVFAVSFLAGTVAPASVRDPMLEVFRMVTANYRGLAGGTLYFNILVQNAMATIFVVFSGAALGIVPMFAIGSNGFGLGILYRQAADGSGHGKALLEILPYGVFEVPALLIAASYGLWIGVQVIQRRRGRESAPLRANVERAFRGYFAVVFPLLVVAAAIETALILWMPKG